MPESLAPEERSRLRNYLLQRAVGLEEIVGRQVAFDEVAGCFLRGSGRLSAALSLFPGRQKKKWLWRKGWKKKSIRH